MRRKIPALLFSCALLLTAASAQKRKVEDPCDNPQTQADMNICAGKKFQAADAELNRVYNRLASKVSGDPKLKAAELSWLKYRDANCDYEASLYEGGSIQPLIYSSCLERMTKARTAELRDQLKEQEQ